MRTIRDWITETSQAQKDTDQKAEKEKMEFMDFRIMGIYA